VDGRSGDRRLEFLQLPSAVDLDLSSRTERGGVGWAWVRDRREAICPGSPRSCYSIKSRLRSDHGGFPFCIGAIFFDRRWRWLMGSSMSAPKTASCMPSTPSQASRACAVASVGRRRPCSPAMILTALIRRLRPRILAAGPSPKHTLRNPGPPELSQASENVLALLQDIKTRQGH